MTLSPAVNVTVFAIRFHKVGKLYHFAAQHHPDLKTGDHVIVETKRGVQMGEVVKRVQDGYNPNEELKPVIRPANARDLVLRQAWQLRELPALITCREQAASLRLQQVKWIKAEYSYDGGFLTFFYAMEEEDQQADQQQLNLLKQKLQQGFGDSHIYFQHIGPRDVAKLLGGYGACGSPTLLLDLPDRF
jgi:cell fate regulator YaaT (PSP1 superfamily)